MERACVTADGVAKLRYPTRAVAVDVIRLMARRGETIDGLQPYRCGTCGWFHIGHYPQNPKTRKARRKQHRRPAP